MKLVDHLAMHLESSPIKVLGIKGQHAQLNNNLTKQIKEALLRPSSLKKCMEF